jgi:hydrogenase maturation factor HypF (carbamoyltransferase family)
MPSTKENFRKIYYEVNQLWKTHLDEEVQFTLTTEQAEKTNSIETESENLQTELRESFGNFLNSMQLIIEEEELTKYEIEESNAAEEEAERKGTVGWQDIRARYNLGN